MVQLTEDDASTPESTEPEPGSEAGASHVETTISVMTGEPIRIFCDCALGRDHRYEEWVARLGPTRLLG